VTIAHGSSRAFYSTPAVQYNESCASVDQTRTCTRGRLSGNELYRYSNCFTEAAPEITNISIRSVPPIVRLGKSVTISWNGGNAEACTVKGFGLNATGITGSERVEDITGESIYTLTCTLGPNTKVETTTVKVLPYIHES
jgi:hypothetical protein